MAENTQKRPLTRLKAVLDLVGTYENIKNFKAKIGDIEVDVEFVRETTEQEYNNEELPEKEKVDYRFFSAG